MNIKLSEKALSIEPSITLEIAAKAKVMKDQGVDIISFSVGEPDFNTPDSISEAGIKAINSGLTKYTAASGIPELKKAICEKFKKDNNLEYGVENIVISNGGKHSIYNICLAILNPGDEVVVGVPYWVSYPEMVKLAGGVPVYIETLEQNDFKFSVSDLEEVRTGNTKAVIINSPNNPTGSAYTKDELEAIAEWAVENNIIIISDELYEKLIYEGGEHVSIASLNDKIKDLTIVVNGMSKAYAMTGWRIGYTAANKEITKIMSNIQSHTTSNPSSISQYASVEALLGDQGYIQYMKEQFDQRRIYMSDAINSIKGLSCRTPKGAFYIMMNFSQFKGKVIHGKLINSSLDFANLLLEKGNVAVVPGLAFGADDFIRMSYANSLENIKEGLKRIKNVLED